jgi:hypothetical protein
MTITTGPSPVSDYLARVRTALADLPAAERDDLIEDLELHLGEVAAEAGGALEDRLGPPEKYAAELRASAGLPPAGKQRRRIGIVDRATVALRSISRQPLVARVVQFLPSLWPGWWVLRGYLVVAAPSLLRGHVPSSLPIPDIGGAAFGTVLVLAAIAVSVWIGVNGWRAPAVRWLLVTANLAIAVVTVAAGLHVRDDLRNRVAESFASTPLAEPSEYSPYLLSPHGRITNIYPFDASGHLLHGVRLYDESGNPINLPDQPDIYGGPLGDDFPVATHGRVIRNAYPVRQTGDPAYCAKACPTGLVIPPKVKITAPKRSSNRATKGSKPGKRASHARRNGHQHHRTAAH